MIIGVFLMSCTNKSKKIEEVIKSFYIAATDSAKGIKATEYYPKFDSLHIKLRSDVVDFDDNMIKVNDTMIVSCQNNYTDERGILHQDSAKFYLTKDKGHYQIVDSKGILQISNSLKNFGKRLVFLPLDKMRDQELAPLLSKLNDFYLSKYLDTYIELKNDVKILSWDWETYDDGEPYGEACFCNDTSLTLSDIMYTIKYFDRNGNVVSEDTGSACNELKPHEKYRFTFYSSHVINPSKANLSLDFNSSTIEQIVQSKNYTKEDFEKYKVR